MTASDGLFGIAAAVLVGSLLAAAVAVGLSSLAPIGPVRPVYPDGGIGFDWTRRTKQAPTISEPSNGSFRGPNHLRSSTPPQSGNPPSQHDRANGTDQPTGPEGTMGRRRGWPPAQARHHLDGFPYCSGAKTPDNRPCNRSVRPTGGWLLGRRRRSRPRLPPPPAAPAGSKERRVDMHMLVRWSAGSSEFCWDRS
jgi:hypothetical protein